MRSKEQFKAYVYAQADAARAKQRKMRRLALGGAAAFCICVCVGSAFFFSGLLRKNGSDSFTSDVSNYDAGEQYFDNAEVTAALPEVAATNATCAMDKATGEGASEETGSADSDPEDEGAGASDMKKYFLSVNACAPSNALIGATHCEVLENDEESDETAALSNAQNAKKQIKVGISAYFISKPSVSSVTVDYRDDAITITVFADQTPTSLGSYLYYSTETLNGEKYIGQPIRLDFKLTPAEDTNSES